MNEKLVEHAEKLFKTFVTKDLKLVEIDSDIKAEYVSQKKYLEKSVNMLKKNLIKVKGLHRITKFTSKMRSGSCAKTLT